MIEIVTRHNLILDAFVVKLDGVVGIIAPEDE
jgi:hypothetical protein